MHLYTSLKTKADKQHPCHQIFQIHPEVGIQTKEIPILPPVMETSRKEKYPQGWLTIQPKRIEAAGSVSQVGGYRRKKVVAFLFIL